MVYIRAFDTEKPEWHGWSLNYVPRVGEIIMDGAVHYQVMQVGYDVRLIEEVVIFIKEATPE